MKMSISIDNDLSSKLSNFSLSQKKPKSHIIQQALLDFFEQKNENFYQKIFTQIESQNQSFNQIQESISKLQSMIFNTKVESDVVNQKINFIIENLFLKDFPNEEKQQHLKNMEDAFFEIARCKK